MPNNLDGSTPDNLQSDTLRAWRLEAAEAVFVLYNGGSHGAVKSVDDVGEILNYQLGSFKRGSESLMTAGEAFVAGFQTSFSFTVLAGEDVSLQRELVQILGELVEIVIVRAGFQREDIKVGGELLNSLVKRHGLIVMHSATGRGFQLTPPGASQLLRLYSPSQISSSCKTKPSTAPSPANSEKAHVDGATFGR